MILFLISNNNQGTSSEKITDAWIYLNGNLEGVYELPATIPLHYEGYKNLVIYQALKKWDCCRQKKVSFYLPFDTICNLIPDSVLNITNNNL